MRGRDFISNVSKVIPVGKYSRLERQIIGLRKLGLYPTDKDKSVTGHVTMVQAAHLIRLMSLNVDPHNPHGLEDKILEHEQLKSNSGSYFILDLAEILATGGLFLPTKKGINHVQRISFSLDRPFAVIVFEDAPGWNGDPEEEKKIIQSERIYGIGDARSFERFSILKRNSLQELAIKLTSTGHDMTYNNPETREAILQHITTLK